MMGLPEFDGGHRKCEKRQTHSKRACTMINLLHRAHDEPRRTVSTRAVCGGGEVDGCTSGTENRKTLDREWKMWIELPRRFESQTWVMPLRCAPRVTASDARD